MEASVGLTQEVPFSQVSGLVRLAEAYNIHDQDVDESWLDEVNMWYFDFDKMAAQDTEDGAEDSAERGTINEQDFLGMEAAVLEKQNLDRTQGEDGYGYGTKIPDGMGGSKQLASTVQGGDYGNYMDNFNDAGDGSKKLMTSVARDLGGDGGGSKQLKASEVQGGNYMDNFGSEGDGSKKLMTLGAKNLGGDGGSSKLKASDVQGGDYLGGGGDGLTQEAPRSKTYLEAVLQQNADAFARGERARRQRAAESRLKTDSIVGVLHLGGDGGGFDKLKASDGQGGDVKEHAVDQTKGAASAKAMADHLQKDFGLSVCADGAEALAAFLNKGGDLQLFIDWARMQPAG